MRFLMGKSGQSTVELVLLIVIIVAVLGTTMFLLYQTIGAKIQEYTDAL